MGSKFPFFTPEQIFGVLAFEQGRITEDKNYDTSSELADCLEELASQLITYANFLRRSSKTSVLECHGTRLCRKCGNTFKGDFSYCPHCGTLIDKEYHID